MRASRGAIRSCSVDIVVQASRLRRSCSRDGRTTIGIRRHRGRLGTAGSRGVGRSGRGVPVGRISARFHNALADMAVAIAQRSGVGPKRCPSCSPADVSKMRCSPPGSARDCRRPGFGCILIRRSRRATAALPSGKCCWACDNCVRPRCRRD